MGFKKQLQYYLDSGCVDYSNRLGIVTTPEGYALLLNSDHSHFFYIKNGVEDESPIHWNRWAVYNWIKKDSEGECRKCDLKKKDNTLVGYIEINGNSCGKTVEKSLLNIGK